MNYVGEQVQEPVGEHDDNIDNVDDNDDNTMTNKPGEQVQEPFGEHPPLRVFQSLPSATQVPQLVIMRTWSSSKSK